MITKPASTLSWMLCTFLCGSVAHAVDFNGQRASKINPGSNSCIDPPATYSFLTTDATVYLYFYATVGSGDKLAYDWVAPDGSILAGGSWGAVPGSYCFTGASLQIANLPSSLLGDWRARIWNNGVYLFPIPFRVDSSGGFTPAGPPTITGLNSSIFPSGAVDVTVSGRNFQQGATVRLDYFVGNTFQWIVAAAIPSVVDSSTQLRVHLSLPDPGEFQLTVKNQDNSTSNIAPFIIGYTGYKMPFGNATTVHVTQGNNDIYDHNLNVFPTVRCI